MIVFRHNNAYWCVHMWWAEGAMCECGNKRALDKILEKFWHKRESDDDEHERTCEWGRKARKMRKKSETERERASVKINLNHFGMIDTNVSKCWRTHFSVQRLSVLYSLLPLAGASSLWISLDICNHSMSTTWQAEKKDSIYVTYALYALLVM